MYVGLHKLKYFLLRISHFLLKFILQKASHVYVWSGKLRGDAVCPSHSPSLALGAPIFCNHRFFSNLHDDLGGAEGAKLAFSRARVPES